MAALWCFWTQVETLQVLCNTLGTHHDQHLPKRCQLYTDPVTIMALRMHRPCDSHVSVLIHKDSDASLSMAG